MGLVILARPPRRKVSTLTTVTSPGLRTEPIRSADRQAELSRVRLRRALVLMVMTLVLPGSAQLVAGRKDVGRWALRIWLGTLGLVALTLGVASLWHGVVFSLGSNTGLLLLVRIWLTLMAVGWALLLIDAWRLGQPLGLTQRQRLAVVGVNGVLVFAVAGSLLFASHIVAVQRDFIIAMFGDGQVSAAEHGRYNVLLIGGDQGAGRWGLRTDSMTIASIDEDTGKTILFGLPRNMTNFPFPEGSVLAEKFPNGYDCETCTLNSLTTWAADHKALFGDSPTPGIDATVMGIEGITGLKINYYALVNMDGFRNLVDAMGGVTLNVRDRIPIELPVTGYIEPGVQKLNGYETLWFARSRESADDYSRMARQKCVMSAMVQQLSPQTVITKFEDLAEAGTELVQTDLPASELDVFAQLALKARTQKIASVSFVPPAILTYDPDIDKIRTMIDDAIEKSEASQSGDESDEGTQVRPSKGFNTRNSGSTTGGSLGSLSTGYAANQADDLTKVC